MTNRQADDKLEGIYGNKCMATGRTDIPSYHHLVKKEHGGKATVENGARLQGRIHEWIHVAIEHNDKELYILINECLDLYKQCMDKGKKELIEQYRTEVMPEYRKKL